MINNLKQKKPERNLFGKSLHWVFCVMFGYGVFKQIQSKEQLNDVWLIKPNYICLNFPGLHSAPLQLHE